MYKYTDNSLSFKIKIMKKYVILNAHTFPETLIFYKNQKTSTYLSIHVV